YFGFYDDLIVGFEAHNWGLSRIKKSCYLVELTRTGWQLDVLHVIAHLGIGIGSGFTVDNQATSNGRSLICDVDSERDPASGPITHRKPTESGANHHFEILAAGHSSFTGA